ncbi:MAG: 50S ribosomal protein L21 [Gemmatimonadetes bacterium]|nr:50S ribosomal protein L21 [Gemmatimonadota bacterium]NIX44210.1 50S ribosomal protein L21 [Gemmatimonadota bacterium]
MFAVIETGGKQYKVREGDTIRVEKLDGEPGSDVTIDRVLMVGDGDSVKVGQPTVDGGSVQATIQDQGRGPKIRIFKKKRRKGYAKRQGHRQSYTELRITGISG